MTVCAASIFCIVCISSHQSSFRTIPESSCRKSAFTASPFSAKQNQRIESVATNQKVLNLQKGSSHSTPSLRHSNISWNRVFKYDHLPVSPSSLSASFRHLIISLY